MYNLVLHIPEYDDAAERLAGLRMRETDDPHGVHPREIPGLRDLEQFTQDHEEGERSPANPPQQAGEEIVRVFQTGFVGDVGPDKSERGKGQEGPSRTGALPLGPRGPAWV